jgi:phage shock protein PspC (stress-responsive transcriptional regulator)
MVTRAQLRRRTEHRLVAGVAGGIADRLNASVAFVRIFIGLAYVVSAPWVLLGYLAAALLIPPRGSGRPDWDNLIAVARLALVFGVPILVFTGEVILSDPVDGPPGWWIAYIGLPAAGGVALLTADYRRDRPRTRAQARAVVIAALPVALSFLALAALMLLAPDVRWERFVPAVAVVGALSLLIAARRGRLAPSLPPALLAVAVAGLVVAGDTRLQGGLGAKTVTPEASVGDRIVVRRAVGSLKLDLRRVTRGGRDATVEASVGVGSLEISVPAHVRVELDARVEKGRIDASLISGVDPLQGFEEHERRSAGPLRPRPTAPTIHVRAEVGVGGIELRGGVGLVEEAS